MEADYPKVYFKKLCVTRLSSAHDAVPHVKVEWVKGSECRIEGSTPFRMSLDQKLVITDFSQLQDMQAGSRCEGRVARERGFPAIGSSCLAGGQDFTHAWHSGFGERYSSQPAIRCSNAGVERVAGEGRDMKTTLASQDVTLLDEHGVGVIVILHGESVNEVPKAGGLP